MGSLGLVAAVAATWLNLSLAQAQEAPALLEVDPPAAEEISLVSLPPFEPSTQSEVLQRRPLLDTMIPSRPRVTVVRYTVQRGDSVFGIARKFNIKPETVLWGSYDVLNDDPHLLRPGQELNILPVDGTFHEWRAGDTIEGVAKKYDVEPEEIIDWPGNGLDPTDLVIEPGDWLVIPGGRRALQTWHVPTIARGSAGVGAALGPGGCSGNYTGGAIGSGGFIWPANQHRVSGNDYWSGHLAIDIAAGIGTPIYAADSGVVVFAGWAYGGYGNAIMIDHGNGWLTLYGHLSQVSVGCGQSVYQGQIIGRGGSSGNSTGPHLHFEVRFQGGFVNPWYVLP